jgi:hypothetical protein
MECKERTKRIGAKIFANHQHQGCMYSGGPMRKGYQLVRAGRAFCESIEIKPNEIRSSNTGMALVHDIPLLTPVLRNRTTSIRSHQEIVCT